MLNTCRTFIVEDQRTARRNLIRMGYSHPISEVTMLELNEHTPETDTLHYLDPIERGENIGLMSEAGLPCVADPGHIIVDQAQRRGIEIVPLVGPSSLMMALMASGFNGQQFAFLGYPPIATEQLLTFVRNAELRIYRDNQTQLMIEAPYRNDKLLAFLAHKLQPATRICVACDIGLPTQFIRTRSAQQWKSDPPVLHKHPTVFLLYK